MKILLKIKAFLCGLTIVLFLSQPAMSNAALLAAPAASTLSLTGAASTILGAPGAVTSGVIAALGTIASVAVPPAVITIALPVAAAAAGGAVLYALSEINSAQALARANTIVENYCAVNLALCYNNTTPGVWRIYQAASGVGGDHVNLFPANLTPNDGNWGLQLDTVGTSLGRPIRQWGLYRNGSLHSRRSYEFNQNGCLCVPVAAPQIRFDMLNPADSKKWSNAGDTIRNLLAPNLVSELLSTAYHTGISPTAPPGAILYPPGLSDSPWSSPSARVAAGAAAGSAAAILAGAAGVDPIAASIIAGAAARAAGDIGGSPSDAGAAAAGSFIGGASSAGAAAAGASAGGGFYNPSGLWIGGAVVGTPANAGNRVAIPRVVASPMPTPTISPTTAPTTAPPQDQFDRPDLAQYQASNYALYPNFVTHASTVFATKFPFDLVGTPPPSDGDGGGCVEVSFFGYARELCMINDVARLLKYPVLLSFAVWFFMAI